MAAPPPGFLARISVNGKFQGSGILVRPGQVLTCFHVLEQAGPRQAIEIELNGQSLTVECPDSQRDETNDLALLRLPNPIEGVEIPEWLGSEAATGRVCGYFAFPGGKYSPGEAMVRGDHADDLEIDLIFRHGASGGAVTRTHHGQQYFVGLICKGEAVVSLAKNKAAVDAFLQAQDTDYYLNILRGETRCMELRDIGADLSAKDKPPAIDALYQPLSTLHSTEQKRKARPKGNQSPDLAGAHTAVPLEQALKEKRLIIEGGPGSGKTTFLRRIAWALCREDRASETLKLPFDGFPLWLRIRDLDEHMTNARAAGKPGPTTFSDPAWLTHFFAFGPAKLQPSFVAAKLADSNSILLIDGLDEAGSTERREQIARMIETAASTSKCRFVVSTRPGGASGKAALSGFATVVVAEWERPDTEAFCLRWSRWLKGNDLAASEHAKGLAEAVAATPRQLRSNPLMLTALAVIYRPDTRLPDERALLYEAIMAWLAKKAEEHARAQSRPEARYTREECLKRLGRLAIEMQDWKADWKDSLVLRVGIDDAARRIEGEFSTVAEADRVDAARAFLEEAHRESGILTLRGREIEFWHRSFQEYLAARRLRGFKERDRLERALKLLYSPEGREVLPLFAGSMSPGANDQLEDIFAELMADISVRESLGERAHAVGVTGAMLADIRKTYRLNRTSEARWNELLEGVLEIFDAKKSAGIPLESRLAAAEALGAPRDPRLHMPWEEEYWVTVPPGSFTMGAQKTNRSDKATYDEEAYDDETPRRVRFDKPFAIGRFPVTVWEYTRYLDDEGGVEPEGWEEQAKRPNCPVTGVSWNEALDYCRWAGRGRKVGLPNEDQWEFAARGEEGRKYPWGHKPPTPAHANYDATKPGRVTPVGLFPLGTTQSGIADMAGNVYEWTRSVYDKNEDVKCVRGGCFYFDARSLRAAYRYLNRAGLRVNFIGFRCLRE